MNRSNYSGVFLFMEGDTDSRLFENFMGRGDCRIISLDNAKNSKKAVISLVRRSSERSIKGVVGIVDADLDRILGDMVTHPNLFYTDTHDMETMILCSDALEKYLSEFSDKKELRRFLKYRGESDIRNVLHECGRKLGYLRALSYTEQLYLKFRGLDFEDFIDEDTMDLDFDRLIGGVKSNTNSPRARGYDLGGGVRRLEKRDDDSWQVCNGHDLTKILSIGIKKKFGKSVSPGLKGRHVERALRIAYTEKQFKKTSLYESLVEWESKNRPFRLLLCT